MNQPDLNQILIGIIDSTVSAFAGARFPELAGRDMTAFVQNLGTLEVVGNQLKEGTLNVSEVTDDGDASDEADQPESAGE